MRKLTHDEISLNRASLDNLSKVRKLPVYVVLHNIRSNYNVGSIFRSSDGAMIEKLFLCGYTPHPPRKEILKTALGATESVNWEYAKNTLDVIKQIKSLGLKIVALELTDNSIPYYDFDKIDFPICLVVGNEISGVSQEILDHCDYAIEIPQYGIKQSLNVAVAYGIAIFKLREIFDKKF
ncbi:MAG: RNA methyltransferase [Ignavibacterium sp.]|nr:RNA methyltransferase [Ignavibacterium sp.]MDW8374472.1 RNA methyltransferase [Ignavibacteriales bacterium]